MKYTQKAIIIISETDKESGFLPLVHGIFTEKYIANLRLDEIKKLPTNLSKNVRQVDISFNFET